MTILPTTLAIAVLATALASFMLAPPTLALKVSTVTLAVALGIWTATGLRRLAKAGSFDEIATRRQSLMVFLAATALTAIMAAVLLVVVP